MHATPLRVELHSDGACAEIDQLGGELRRWCAQGHELLWNADPRWWPRSSPVLFPIIGRLRGDHTRIGLQTYRMEPHGFTGKLPFERRSVQADQVTLGLASCDATRAPYPFEFDLELRYRLRAETLEVTVSVANHGHESMPFALGLHPGFRWPFSTAATHGHAIVFGQTESPRVPVITPEALFSNTWRELALQGQRLALDPSLFSSNALCFLDAKSRALRFESPDGAAIVVETDNFPHWALWTKPGAPFLCIEAWTGHGDPHDFTGQFAEKPSMRHLAPGAISRHNMTLRFEAGAMK